MLLGAVFEVASAVRAFDGITDVILNYEYINRNWLEEYILSIVFLVVNGVVMGFVGLGIDKLYPDRFSNNTLINKALGFCIGLLQMRVFVETLYAAVASVKSERGDKSAQDDTVNSTGASRTRTVGGHTVSLAEATSEDDGRRGKQLEHGLLYATFIQVIVRDIPLFVLQANATIHYRKWKFIDLFTVFSTFITLTRGTAAASQSLFTGSDHMLAILWTANLRLAHTSHRFVDQLPRAVVFFTFFTLFVVDGSRLTARYGSALPALRSRKLLHLHLWRCLENVVGILLAVFLPRYTDFGVSSDAIVGVIGVICASTLRAAEAQVLRPDRGIAASTKTSIEAGCNRFNSHFSNHRRLDLTRRQANTSSTITEKERLPTQEQPVGQTTQAIEVGTEMRDLKKLGALQQEKRPPERKPKGPATKKSKCVAATASVDPRTLFLHDKRVLLVPFGPDMGRKRIEILQGLIEKLGGNVVESLLKSGPGQAAEFLRIDKFPPPSIEVYTPEWLVFLWQEKKIPAAGSMLTWAEQQQVQEEAARHEQHCEEVAQQLEEKQARQDKGDESESDEGSDSENSGTRQIVRVPPVEVNSEEVREQQAELNEKNESWWRSAHPFSTRTTPFRPITESAVPDSKKIKGEGFICQRSSAVQQNLNAHLTDPLEEMMEFLDVERDVWRQYMYKKVVSSLKGMRHRVCSVKDFKDMHWVKGRLRDKVIEILETGRLAKLDAKKSNPRLRALVEIARSGVSAQLLQRNSMAKGTSQWQNYGRLKLPRAEVHQIEQTVVDEVHKMIPNAIALACGSYRRGKLSSGDCDVLITDPDADTCDILPDLLKRLHASGFLTDDLTHFQKQKTGGCDTYMGVCRVSKDLPYRRLDIKIYPRHFFGFAMLYFTGSDHFNRSMRLFANKNGWSLSDLDVFIALGLEYKDPTERNCFDIKFIEEDEAKANETPTLLRMELVASKRWKLSGVQISNAAVPGEPGDVQLFLALCYVLLTAMAVNKYLEVRGVLKRLQHTTWSTVQLLILSVALGSFFRSATFSTLCILDSQATADLPTGISGNNPWTRGVYRRISGEKTQRTQMEILQGATPRRSWISTTKWWQCCSICQISSSFRPIYCWCWCGLKLFSRLFLYDTNGIFDHEKQDRLSVTQAMLLVVVFIAAELMPIYLTLDKRLLAMLSVENYEPLLENSEFYLASSQLPFQPSPVLMQLLQNDRRRRSSGGLRSSAKQQLKSADYLDRKFESEIRQHYEVENAQHCGKWKQFHLRASEARRQLASAIERDFPQDWVQQERFNIQEAFTNQTKKLQDDLNVFLEQLKAEFVDERQRVLSRQPNRACNQKRNRYQESTTVTRPASSSKATLSVGCCCKQLLLYLLNQQMQKKDLCSGEEQQRGQEFALARDVLATTLMKPKTSWTNFEGSCNSTKK
ncbi:DNA polymerase beta, thumb domain [Phytophthora cactorum]|nr:DNA polymerase beta, thumb domain [Phytophthora cactorum]